MEEVLLQKTLIKFFMHNLKTSKENIPETGSERQHIKYYASSLWLERVRE